MASTLRPIRPINGRTNRPSTSTIERLVEKIVGKFVPVPVRQRSAHSVKNIAAAKASVKESRNVLLTRAQNLRTKVTDSEFQ